MSEKSASSRVRRRSFPGTDAGPLDDAASETLESDPRGRPRGSPNRQVEQVDVPASSCTKCGSTRRGAYFNRRDVQLQGVCPRTGTAFTKIVYRRTACLDCGQHRDDRQLVNEPEQPRG